MLAGGVTLRDVILRGGEAGVRDRTSVGTVDAVDRSNHDVCGVMVPVYCICTVCACTVPRRAFRPPQDDIVLEHDIVPEDDIAIEGDIAL